MKKILDLPCKDKLDNSTAFICRFREWLGEGYDLLIWYRDTEGKCHYFQSYMGETLDKESTPKVIIHEDISSQIFDKFLESLTQNGILEFQMDENPKIMNN